MHIFIYTHTECPLFSTEESKCQYLFKSVYLILCKAGTGRSSQKPIDPHPSKIENSK